MRGSRSFKDLVVWQRSIELVREVYQVTKHLPKSEAFSLSSQLRRSAISIPSNIAEGSKRGTQKDFCQFLRIAQGSLAELETQLLIAEAEYSRVQYSEALALLLEVERMLHRLVESMATKATKN